MDNFLNQIILEGRTKKAFYEDGRGRIFIETSRKIQASKDQWTEEKSQIEIQVYGPLVDVCKNWAVKNRILRIVGRLKQDKRKIVVIGDHVEFKFEGGEK